MEIISNSNLKKVYLNNQCVGGDEFFESINWFVCETYKCNNIELLT